MGTTKMDTTKMVYNLKTGTTKMDTTKTDMT